ncbi:MAG: glycoside hydrolase family 65 protein [Oscillochloris sp.]|nr:glycoside hydrolase family 65 protein [Oscillochloris sp.]
MQTQIPLTYTSDPRWHLVIDGFTAARERQVEAVCALVNGYLGVRAALEEGHAASVPATFVAGIFNTPEQPQAPELEAPIPELVVMPDWSRLRMLLDGTELRLDNAELLEQQRILDMRRGLLIRTWKLRDPLGRITAFTSMRFASLDDRRVLGQFFDITAENYSGTLTLETFLDGAVSNEYETKHLAIDAVRAPEFGELLAVRTIQSNYKFALAAATWLIAADGEILNGHGFSDDLRAGRRWQIELAPGRTCQLQKLVAVASSREEADPTAMVITNREHLIKRGIADLLAAHMDAWAARWERGDAEIPGDDELQRQMRFAIYHLIGAANPADDHSSIGARALTGERYRGHVFWDTEIFVWPALLYTHPATARALLMYRYHTLAGARAKAKASGYQGAMYPWEAADTGTEVTPDYMLSGMERVPVLTGIQEHHISADVALAVLHYLRASADRTFLLEAGAEIVLDVARFWASRVRLEADGQYHIRRVIGPDEYHETVDNNAYTNGLAAYVLAQAAALAGDLAETAPQRWSELGAALNLAPDDPVQWRVIAAGLVQGLDTATGLFEQFDGYHRLEEIDLSDHDTNIATIDAKLGWHAMQRTKVLKQADVLMLIILLWEQYSPQVRAANFAYYEPKTSHDSSLSAGFHALYAARMNELAMAERYLRRAALIDLDLARRGYAGASGGVHIAALGGIWQALALGFLGMQPDNEGLRFAPHIPPAWGSLRMAITWRGAQIHVTAQPDGAVAVKMNHGDPIRVARADGPWRTASVGEAIDL